MQPVHGFLQRGGGGFSNGLEGRWVKRSAVRQPGALDQVVRLVHQQAHPQFLIQRERPGTRAEVEEMVEIAHDHIAPVQHVLTQVIRAHAVLERNGTQRGLVEPARLCSVLAGLRQAIVEAPRERASIPVAGFVEVFAGFLARHEFQHAQRPHLQSLQGMQRQLATRGFGRKVEEFVRALPRRCAQRREQCGHGLADAGGCLREQVAPGAVGTVHGSGHLALTGSKCLKRKAQRLQRRVARHAVQALGASPAGVAGAQRFKKGLQLHGAVPHRQHGFLSGVDVEINQRHFDALQTELLAQHPGVHAGLRPVKGAMVVGDAVGISPVGLDLFQPWRGGVEAVGAALHQQLAETRAEFDFALVARLAPSGDGGVSLNAVLRAGRGRETQVQIAGLGRERAEHTHRHRGRGWRFVGQERGRHHAAWYWIYSQ